jgi:hypothetical protein
MGYNLTSLLPSTLPLLNMRFPNPPVLNTFLSIWDMSYPTAALISRNSISKVDCQLIALLYHPTLVSRIINTVGTEVDRGVSTFAVSSIRHSPAPVEAYSTTSTIPINKFTFLNRSSNRFTMCRRSMALQRVALALFSLGKTVQLRVSRVGSASAL